jgi:hypothetical protein
VSWIWGYCGAEQNSSIRLSNEIRSKELFNYSGSSFKIACGGINETTFYSCSKEENKGWIICGIGLSAAGNNKKIFGIEDWRLELSKEDFLGNDLDGHFIAVKWENNRVEFITDRLGLRDIYIAKYEHGYIFSTRLDWISKAAGGKIDFTVFGSRWLLFNQISGESIIDKAVRVCSGAKAVIENESLTVQKNNWLPQIANNNKIAGNVEDGYYDYLKSLVLLPFSSNGSLSLSLSGGMDSRVILSFLLSENKNWDAHTFGSIKTPDSVIANRIADHFRLKHVQFDKELPDKNSCENLLKEFIAQTFVNNPASSVIQFRYYNELYKTNNIIIDGGFGEIWRREFFNRLLIRGKNALVKKDVKTVSKYLTVFKADIFSDGIIDTMKKGCIEQVENIFTELPSLQSISAEDWLDLFSIKTRLLNFYSHEQTRLDGIVCSYMPLAQPSLLNYFQFINNKSRKNGQLYRAIIKRNCNKLSSFPLAKGGTSHPFLFNSIESRLWTLLMKKTGRYRVDTTAIKFLNHIEEFVRDKVSSKEVIECEYYNYNKVKKMADGFYNGDYSYTQQLDWWLAFEMFRESV